MPIVVETDSLKWLLSLMQRKQTIDGKSIAQVHSLSLKAEGSRLVACTRVKDGLTSLMRLSIPCSGEGEFVLTDIEAALGVLKYHGGAIYITPSEDKVKFKSSGKQTTLTASKEARAFPHTPETIALWTEKSYALADKIDADNMQYKTNDGQLLDVVMCLSDLSTTTLYEAFRCDSMNGQKFNKYTIDYTGGELNITVGDELKGKTTTHINEVLYSYVDLPEHDAPDIKATYNGGLEYIFHHLNSDVNIGVWDFTHVGMGYPMLITLGDGDFIFQVSNEA